MVALEPATLGRREPVWTGICLANLTVDAATPVYLAWAAEDVALALGQ